LKILTYLQYFFYLGLNWNWRIAFNIISQEIKGEKKYNINTTGADELKNLSKKGIDISHATIYMPISYSLLENIFNQLPAISKKHFLDIGCGKGRVLCVAADNGYKKITGIDFSKQLCENALTNLQHTKEKFPSIQYDVITKDAMNFEIPADVDCIFLFNPFDVVIMTAVVSNIMESVREHPREIVVAYANPLYEDVFLEEGFIEIFHTKEMKYLEAAILKLPVLT
jgi:2-polyprenyl-3-methyl-5-hydroxy-6-metoxy-1,4-benzoquinol methylase